MPYGLFLMIGISFLVFRRACSVRRRAWLWVLVLWLLTFFFTFAGTAVGAGIAMFRAPEELTDDELRSAETLPAYIGMFIGVAISVWASGRVQLTNAERDIAI